MNTAAGLEHLSWTRSLVSFPALLFGRPARCNVANEDTREEDLEEGISMRAAEGNQDWIYYRSLRHVYNVMG